MTKMLSTLGLSVTGKAKGKITVSVPTFRPDLTRPVDLIEEVARLYGYDRLQGSMPLEKMAPIIRPRFMDQERAVRDALVGAGASEVVLLGFVNETSLSHFSSLGQSPVLIANPLSQDQGVMCTTLLPGLMDAAPCR